MVMCRKLNSFFLKTTSQVFLGRASYLTPISDLLVAEDHKRKILVTYHELENMSHKLVPTLRKKVVVDYLDVRHDDQPTTQTLLLVLCRQVSQQPLKQADSGRA
nr:PREDICTED: uncharacterized protein LOC109035988 [Bemisia tabaci]